MDPWKVLGMSPFSIRGDADLEKVRKRSSELWKKYKQEKRENELKLVSKAFETLKQKYKSASTADPAAKRKRTADGSAVSSASFGANGAVRAVSSGASTVNPAAKRSRTADGSAVSSASFGANGAVRAVSSGASTVNPAAKRSRTAEGSAVSFASSGANGAVRAVSSGASTVNPAAKRSRTADCSAVSFASSGANGAVRAVSSGAQPTWYVCSQGCGQSYETLPRCVPSSGFVCPTCRFREMDPLNPILDAQRGALKVIIFQPPIIPKNARQSAWLRFSLNVPLLAEWRKKGHTIEVRMCCLNTNEADHQWSQEFAMKINGTRVINIVPGQAGHKRRDKPEQITSFLKPGRNVIEVSLKDVCVTRWAMGILRAEPRLERKISMSVKPEPEESCKQRVYNLLFNSMLEGQSMEVEATGNDRCRLVCPITLAKIEVPARGRKCRHLQSFDLKGYVQSNSRMENINLRWRCPVCHLKLLPPKDLFIDTFLLNILGETELMDEEISFTETCEWRVTVKGEAAPEEEEEESDMDEGMANIMRAFSDPLLQQRNEASASPPSASPPDLSSPAAAGASAEGASPAASPGEDACFAVDEEEDGQLPLSFAQSPFPMSPLPPMTPFCEADVGGEDDDVMECGLGSPDAEGEGEGDVDGGAPADAAEEGEVQIDAALVAELASPLPEASPTASPVGAGSDTNGAGAGAAAAVSSATPQEEGGSAAATDAAPAAASAPAKGTTNGHVRAEEVIAVSIDEYNVEIASYSAGESSGEEEEDPYADAAAVVEDPYATVEALDDASAAAGAGAGASAAGTAAGRAAAARAKPKVSISFREEDASDDSL
eukprot:TRINITY_DN7454_c1_g1_i7.p1 TRINITY_DN7454_c1_g1~~TRINITY_DN7454_c1_g1_i7.p1  ORF type:complete len:833 (+),score=176.08 TRINITY_DN7454_c1_g1_i7:168-2666(+)